MRIHPHWLDGEVVRLYCNGKGGADRALNEILRLTKLNALLGNTMVLSDMHTLDSQGVSWLFSDPGFRKFASERGSFLELVAEPTAMDAPLEWRIVSKAIERSQARNWVSSMCYGYPELVVQLGTAILAEQDIAPARQLDGSNNRPVSRFFSSIKTSPWRDSLTGSLYAMDHFLHAASKFCVYGRPEGPYYDYYSVLQESKREQDLSPYDREIVELTIDFIDKHVDSERDRTRRSVVMKHLNIDFDSDHARIWNTIVLAWNSANQRSLSLNCGSLTSLPEAGLVGLYRGQLSDAAMYISVRDRVVITPAALPSTDIVTMHFDPLNAPWLKILEAVQSTADSSMLELQTALSKSERSESEIADALRQHCSALSRVLSPEYDIGIPSWVWIIVGAIAAVGLQIGGAGPIAVGAGGLIPRVAPEAASLALRKTHQFACAHMLEKMATPLSSAPARVN